jgi:muramoyltetrapeptide carboxypeptidase LdcA involved in peptidoglycan recycling
VQGERGAEAAGDQAHGQVAVARQRGLDDGQIKLECADSQHRRVYTLTAMSTHADPDRVHVIAHANPPRNDIAKLGFASVGEYIAFIRAHTPGPLRLTCGARFFHVNEDEWHSGRRDDAARIRDLQDAIDDPRTLAIIATNGGAYFSRILPHVDFSRLARRREPLWVLGFSEMTTLVNLVASYRCGRGLYWLCPNYVAWKIRPRKTARAAFAEFWQLLPQVLAGRKTPDARYLDFSPIRGELVAGRAEGGRVRLIGGCLAVLAAVLSGPLGARLRPEGKWLFLEDVQEAPYRIDRHLAALKFAGWYERIAGVLIGDFHTLEANTQDAVLDLLKFHLPRQRRLPVVRTRCFGHVWPLVPVAVNQPLRVEVRGREVTFAR